MASPSRHLLGRLFPRAKFVKDSIWSVPIVVGGFASMFLLVGINHSLGSFFEIWLNEFSTSRSILLWVQSLGFFFSFLSPIHAFALSRFSGQLVLVVASLVLAAAYIAASLASSSVATLIILLGATSFCVGGSIMLFPMNLIGRTTQKYRALAYGISNSGAPVGMMILPLLADSVIASHGWKRSLMVLGILWLLILIFVIFMIELEENKNKQSIVKNEQSIVNVNNIQTIDHLIENRDEANPFPDYPPKIEPHFLQSSVQILMRILRNRILVVFLIYGFFEGKIMFGIRVFLPPLLSESFSDHWNVTDNETTVSVLAQHRISRVLSSYGVGGIVGVLFFGPLLSWGPMVSHKMLVLIINSVYNVVNTLLYIFVINSFVGILLLTASLGFCHQGWYCLAWVIIYELCDSDHNSDSDSDHNSDYVDPNHAHSDRADQFYSDHTDTHHDQFDRNSDHFYSVHVNSDHTASDHNRVDATLFSSLFWCVNSVSAISIPAALSALISAFDDDAACGTESTPRFYRRPSSVAVVAMVASTGAVAVGCLMLMGLEKRSRRRNEEEEEEEEKEE